MISSTPNTSLAQKAHILYLAFTPHHPLRRIRKMKTPVIRCWVVFTLSTLLFVMSQFYRVSMTVITPQLLEDLSLSHQQLGTCSAAFFYAFALTQIPIIIYLDRIGARLSMTALTLIGIGGAVIFASAQSYATLLLGRLLMGIGMACNLVGSLKLITQWFRPERFATLTALIASLGTAGNLMAATPLVILVQMIGWRFAFGLCALFNLLLVCLFFFVVKNSPQDTHFTKAMANERQDRSSPLAGVRQLFSLKDYWVISLGTFCRYGVFAAVQALWAGPFLMQVMGYSEIRTGNLLLLLNMGFIAGGPFFGAMSDSVIQSRKIVIITGLAGLAMGLAILVLLPHDTPLFIIAFLFGSIGLFSSAGTIMYPHIKELMPLTLSGTATTGLNLFTMAGAAVFLQGLGALMQWLTPMVKMTSTIFDLSFGLCSGLLILTAVVYAFGTRETLTRTRKN